MKPRLLLVAYCCSPDGGSEPAVGWTLARLAAERFDTTVLVETQFRPAIARWLRENGPLENLRFQFVPEKWWAHGMWEAGLGYVSYRWWHQRALAVADSLHAEEPFDAVQLGTIIGFREPGYWTRLGLPFVWGPVGGTHNYPAAFLPEAGFKAGLKERLRTVLNNRQLRGRRVAEALSDAHTVVAATRDTRDALRRIVDRDVEVVSELTVPEGPPRPPRTPEPGELKVLWSGLHEPRKCLSLLLKAAAGLPVRVRVLGDGEMRGRWQRVAEEAGVADRVEWMGWVPHAAAAAHYDWADAFAFTSVRDTTGTVLLEALAAGLPVVTLDHQGARDVVTDDCGLRVSADSPAKAVGELHEALRTLATDLGLRRRLSEGAVRRADAYRIDAKRAQWNDVWDHVPALRRRSQVRSAKPAAVPVVNAAAAANVAAIELPPLLPGNLTGGSGLRQRVRQWKSWAGVKAMSVTAILPEREPNAVGVINYHRVHPLAGLPLSVTPQAFRRQLKGLLDRGYEGITASDLCEAYESGRPLPLRRFVVTFDDGFDNVRKYALPVLRELGVPVTVLLTTGRIGEDSFDFDPLVYGDGRKNDVSVQLWGEAVRPLDMAGIEELADSGLVEFGCHTHTHRDFTGDVAAFEADMRQSLAWLSEHLGLVRPAFSYPYGGNDPEMREACRRLGVRCGMTTEADLVRAGSDAMAWGRFGGDEYDTGATLAAKVGGWYAAARRTWRRIAYAEHPNLPTPARAGAPQ